MSLSRILQETIRIQKQQYYGSVPLTIQERFTDKIKQTTLNNNLAFKALCNARKTENECSVLKEQLQEEYQFVEQLKSQFREDGSVKNLLSLQDECKIMKLENLKLKRSVEFKKHEIQQLQDRLHKQDEDITKLEEELLKFYQNGVLEKTETIPSTSDIAEKPIKLFTSNQTQTQDIVNRDMNQNFANLQDKLNKLQLNILEKEKETLEKGNEIIQLKNTIAELEMNVNLLKQQINDKQSQIMFYENHILELRGQIEKVEKIPVDNTIEIIEQRNEETLLLKVVVLFFVS